MIPNTNGKRIILASNNADKIVEIKEILKDFNFHIITMKEAGINQDIEENGSTFIENAEIKAQAVFSILKDDMILADDSGLSVDILGGAPGVLSARFAGEHGNDEKNNEKLLKLLQEKTGEERKAKFVCAMVLILDKDNIIKVQGEVQGYITREPRGDKGFGYDPLFYYPPFSQTFGEVAGEKKNHISHRGRAVEKLGIKLKEVTAGGLR